MLIQAAVAIVIANGIGGAEIGNPSGFEQRNQPGLMLARDRHGPGYRQGQRASLADGGIKDGIDAT